MYLNTWSPFRFLKNLSAYMCTYTYSLLKNNETLYQHLKSEPAFQSVMAHALCSVVLLVSVNRDLAAAA